MRDFDGPEEFLESLRDADITGTPSSLRYAQVQALKFLQTRATPSAARARHPPAQGRPRGGRPRRELTCRGKENLAAQ